MKNLFFALAFMLMGTFAFANNTDTTDFTIKLKKIVIVEQNCNEYAANAADEEVGFWENFFSQGQSYINSYSYWLGYCEGASAGGATVLKPVFIK